MAREHNIQEGMQVIGEGEQLIGRVERVHGDGFDVEGRHYTREMVGRVAQQRVYLRNVGSAAARDLVATDTTNTTGLVEATEGEIRVPVVEERLAVGTREVGLGEVDIRKTVVEEEQSASVTLHRDEVTFHERAVEERPLRAGETAFEEGTIRVELRGEEAVVAKETVVTGEVVIDKERVAEERTITDTVRRQRVDVEENYRQVRGEFEQDFTTRAAGTDRTFAQAESNYRTGFEAAHDERYSGREFEDVEPELRRTHGADDDTWTRLRDEIRSGWNKARGR